VTLRLRITDRAAGEIERADAWWRENRRAVPGALREDLKAVFKLLLQQPGVGIKLRSAGLTGTRRLHLERIRYFVYYRVKSRELVVLSVWHSSRGRGPRV
jgi:plasmid stabilization system protein ParE